MLGTFVASKAKALKAAQQGFKKGGYTGDGSPNSEAGVVHGQEFVSTAKTTKRFRPLLEAIHANRVTPEQVGIHNGIFDGIKNTSEKQPIFMSDNSGVEDRLDQLITLEKSQTRSGIKRRRF
jgi:hypothetical protein